MIHQKHPEVADTMISNLSERSRIRHVDAVAACREELRAMEGTLHSSATSHC